MKPTTDFKDVRDELFSAIDYLDVSKPGRAAAFLGVALTRLSKMAVHSKVVSSVESAISYIDEGKHASAAAMTQSAIEEWQAVK